VIDTESTLNVKYSTTHPNDAKMLVYIVHYPQVSECQLSVRACGV
jgi:hypothetical protein